MSEESVIIHNEDSEPVTIKLSTTGRISLSDITAATIGNLETWSNPDTVTHVTEDNIPVTSSEVSVLRPWEDKCLYSKSNTEFDQYKDQHSSLNFESPINSTQSDQNSHVSNTSDQIKRQLEEFYNIADGPQWKRQRLYVDTKNRAETATTTESEKPSTETFVRNIQDLGVFHTTKSECVQNYAYPPLTPQNKVTDNYAYPPLTPLNKVTPSYAYPSLSELCDSRSTDSQNSSNSWQTPNSHQSYTAHNSEIRPHQHDIDTRMNQSGSSMGSISNFYRDHIKADDTSRALCNFPNLHCKNEPVTPVAKKPSILPGYNMYDSPGVESRFNESLSNLIGSPPPDSPLSKNPFFSDLQALLSTECKSELVPKTLFGIHETTPKMVEEENIFVRERKLHDRFNDLQVSHADEVRNLSSFFRYQTAMIETERFRTLHENQYPKEFKASVNRFYDNKIHKVIDRVEQSVILLENANKENSAKKMIIKPRPHLSRESVQLMENWYKSNMDHPYPTNTTIELLASNGNLSTDQVKKWFANKRNRCQNTRTLTEIAMKKRKLGHLAGPH